MKKYLSTAFIVVVLMAICTSTVFAAPAQDSKSVTFVGMEYQQGGIVLLFHTSGLTKSDLKNVSFYADSNNQNISCNFIDDTTDVRCVVSKKLAETGGSFHVVLAGFGFYGDFPENSYCGEGESPWYGYNIYENGELVYSGEVPTVIWDYAAELGYFEVWAELGITYEITGNFCSSEELLPPA